MDSADDSALSATSGAARGKEEMVMENDIVERLRMAAAAIQGRGWSNWAAWVREAADEIERLRQAEAEIDRLQARITLLIDHAEKSEAEIDRLSAAAPDPAPLPGVNWRDLRARHREAKRREREHNRAVAVEAHKC